MVRSFHIGVRIRNRQNEIDIKVVDNIGDKPKQNNEASVFKIGKLNVQGSELNPPSDFRRLRRWWLKTH